MYPPGLAPRPLLATPRGSRSLAPGQHRRNLLSHKETPRARGIVVPRAIQRAPRHGQALLVGEGGLLVSEGTEEGLHLLNETVHAAYPRTDLCHAGAVLAH